MQQGFSDIEYLAKKRLTRRERFLQEIERLTPWEELQAVVAPFYPSGRRGRPTCGAGHMLRMYVAQQCLGLSDEGIEDAIYDSHAVRRFVGIDLARETAPDATTLLRFRRLLEENKLSESFLQTINAHLTAKGLMMRTGTVVDATIIHAPSSTKNKDKTCDPEMHSTKKGNEWHFGMKAHIGVDAESGLAHTLVTTAANTSDVVVGAQLLHGEEQAVYADAGYVGIEKRQIVAEPAVTEEDKASAPEWHIAMRRGKLKALSDDLYGRVCRRLEYLKAHTRSKVEHVFHVIKNRFGLRKVRYKGLAKNTVQLYSLLGFANLLLAGRQFAAPRANGGMYTQSAS